jgi:hypothetical protein
MGEGRKNKNKLIKGNLYHIDFDNYHYHNHKLKRWYNINVLDSNPNNVPRLYLIYRRIILLQIWMEKTKS